MSERDRIEELLEELRMPTARNVAGALVKEAQEKKRSFSWYLAQLLEQEVAGRQVRATDNRMCAARFPEEWTLKTFPWGRQPAVDRMEIMELAELEFVRLASNIVFIGDVGVGKSGLAMGLGREAVGAGYSALFCKVHDLVEQLYASVMDRSTARVIRRLARIDLLVLDEFSYVTLNEEQSNLIFKLIDARYHRKSTIFTTNLGFNEWGTFFSNKALERSLVDRVTDQCYVVRIEGPSLRPGPRPSRAAAKSKAGALSGQTGQGRKNKEISTSSGQAA
ncbi:MAG: ATP-binding protein [Candidatus Wallbacteria bacterium]|nr:ATP-binding protein [Candidatus Wallbacteria bacterium]